MPDQPHDHTTAPDGEPATPPPAAPMSQTATQASDAATSTPDAAPEDTALEALADAAMARIDHDFARTLGAKDRAEVRKRVGRLLRSTRALRQTPLANGDAPAWQFVPPPPVDAVPVPPSTAGAAPAAASGAATDRSPPPAFASVAELGRMLRAGETDPLHLAELALERLERLGPQLNALVTPLRDRALREARRAGDELRAGRDRGPLHGIPYGAKDLLATGDGSPTTWGAAPFREQRFSEDAAVLRRLEAAGAVLVAKLAMVELAGGFGYDQPDAAFSGPGRNPWDTECWSGGSSSGSGSAVGAGLLPWAVGSETWGSITTPAGFCGLSGLRPTFGRVSTRGAMALCWSLDKLGPMCRSAEDCGLALEAMAGADPADPEDSAPPWRFHRDGWRAGNFRLAMARGLPADGGLQPAVRERFAAALEELRAFAGIEVIDLPAFPYAEAMQTILGAEAASAFEDFLETDGPAQLTAPEDHAGGYAGTTIRAVDYLRALRIRQQVATTWALLLAPYDALVTPTLAGVAPAIGEHFSTAMARGSAAVRDIGAAGNLVGLPAITVPMGPDPAGLPTGLAFLGRAHSEQSILNVAMAFQQRTRWHRDHPDW